MADTDAGPRRENGNLDPGQERYVRRCYPDFRVSQVLATTGKAVLLAGTYRGQPAVLKALTDQTQRWRERFAREAAVYGALAAMAPPVRVPTLLAPPAPGLLLIEQLPGRPLAHRRYPDTPLSAVAAAALLHVADALADWVAPAALGPAVDYRRRIFRYGPAGYRVFDEETVTALLALYQRVAGRSPWRFAHGDLLPANVLLDEAGVPSVLDWEYAGLFLPGYDRALLWIIFMDDSDLQARVRSDPDGDAFWLNAAILLAREVRMHRDEADRNPALRARLDRLRPLAAEVAHVVAARL